MRKGKKYIESAKLVDRSKLYDTEEALDTVVKTAKAKFDETVEIHVKLGVDSRHLTHMFKYGKQLVKNKMAADKAAAEAKKAAEEKKEAVNK